MIHQSLKTAISARPALTVFSETVSTAKTTQVTVLGGKLSSLQALASFH